ncbi:Uncharacterised protein [Providencia rettgeri]|nr:Uncharacterised protein [Providencia rettgeri]
MINSFSSKVRSNLLGYELLIFDVLLEEIGMFSHLPFELQWNNNTLSFFSSKTLFVVWMNVDSLASDVKIIFLDVNFLFFFSVNFLTLS